MIGGDALERCKAAIGAVGECIVSQRSSGPVPLRRMEAVKQARGKFVALIEDTVIPIEGWAEATASCLANSDIVGCGGPVRLSPSLRAQSAALALADFGRFSPDLVKREDLPVTGLPGCNMAFQRDALITAMDPADGLVDQNVFGALRGKAGRLALVAEMSVTYCEDHAEATNLVNRFEHGRIYASRTLENGSIAARALAVVRSLALPLVLTGRVARKGATVPILGWALLQNSAWSIGELVGSLSSRRHDMSHWS